MSSQIPRKWQNPLRAKPLHKSSAKRLLSIEPLDPRLMMDAGGLDPGGFDAGRGPVEAAQYQIPDVVSDFPANLSSIPELNSNPDASATIFLDFDGHIQEGWNESGVEDATGLFRHEALSLDDNPLFNAEELSLIHDIWASVSEDFAPFNVNVTTVEPSSFADGEALRAIIGAEMNNKHGDVGGRAMRGSFSDPDLANVAFILADNILGSEEGVAEGTQLMPDDRAINFSNVISHEVGHTLGLTHYSVFTQDNQGNFVFEKEYAKGNHWIRPLMGAAYGPERSVWQMSEIEIAGNYGLQDDMEVIAGETNGFGYRADDHGDYWWDATPISAGASGNFEATGIIAQTFDADVFSFSTLGGQATIDLDVAALHPNLDSRLEVWQKTTFSVDQSYASAVQVLAIDDEALALGASISVDLMPGQYFIAVKSHGEYGDVGQYTLSGSLFDPMLPSKEVLEPLADPSAERVIDPIGPRVQERFEQEIIDRHNITGSTPKLTPAGKQTAGDRTDAGWRATGFDFMSWQRQLDVAEANLSTPKLQTWQATFGVTLDREAVATARTEFEAAELVDAAMAMYDSTESSTTERVATHSLPLAEASYDAVFSSTVLDPVAVESTTSAETKKTTEIERTDDNDRTIGELDASLR